MKKYTLSIILLLLLVFSACTAKVPLKTDPLDTNPSNESGLNNESQEQQNPSETDGPGSVEEENAIKEIMRELVEENYTCITELFYFGNLPHGQVEMNGNVPIAKVESSKYKTLEELKAHLYGIYTSEEADRLIYNYFDERPLYFEKDGELYINVDQTSAAGIPIPWESFEINIRSYDANMCSFVAEVTFIEDAKINEKGIYSFEAVNSDGWRLKAVIKSPSA